MFLWYGERASTSTLWQNDQNNPIFKFPYFFARNFILFPLFFFSFIFVCIKITIKSAQLTWLNWQNRFTNERAKGMKRKWKVFFQKRSKFCHHNLFDSDCSLFINLYSRMFRHSLSSHLCFGKHEKFSLRIFLKTEGGIKIKISVPFPCTKVILFHRYLNVIWINFNGPITSSINDCIYL